MAVGSLLAAALLTTYATGVNQALPYGLVFEDLEDTTSFNNGHVFSEDNRVVGEVYGRYDTYDYIVYTPAYTRTIFVYLEVNNNQYGRVSLYNPSYNFTEPWIQYLSETPMSAPLLYYAPQGEMVFIKIECSGNCLWTATLDINPNPSGYSYFSYSKFNGYTMPHSGPAVIYYKKDSSCDQLVPEQDFTYSDVIDDAIAIWESVGLVTFEENNSKKLFTINAGNYPSLQVYHMQIPLTNNYKCYEMNVPHSYQYYSDLIWECLNGIGEPFTIYDAVLGTFVKAFGISLGLMNCDAQSYYYNVMQYITKPFSCLGDGDIKSFIMLWGDANEYEG